MTAETGFTHGTRYGYVSRECRCEDCAEWKRDNRRAYNARRAAKDPAYWRSRFSAVAGGAARSIAGERDAALAQAARYRAALEQVYQTAPEAHRRIIRAALEGDR